MRPLFQGVAFWCPPIIRGLALAMMFLAPLAGPSLHAGAWMKYLSAFGTDENWTATPPIDAAGNIYLSSTSGTVLALRASDGAEVWRKSLGGQGNTALLVTREGFLVAGVTRERKGFLIAMETSTGNAVWTNVVSDFWVTPGATSPDGVVFATTDQSILAVRSQNGETLWFAPLAEATGKGYVGFIRGDTLSVGHGIVTLFEGAISMVDPDLLHAFDVASGSLRWTKTNVTSAAVPAIDGTFVVSSTATVASINSTNGRVVWSSAASTGAAFRRPLSFASTNVALISGGKADWYRLNTSLRRLSLLKQLPQQVAEVEQPTVSADGTVYFSASKFDNTSELFVFGITNEFSSSATLLWQTNLPLYAASPVIAPDGTVIVVRPQLGFVQAFNGASPLAATHWPKPRGDMANSACEPSFYLGEPVIVIAPTNRTVTAGTRVVLPASVKGLRPLTVQWFKGDSPLGAIESVHWTIPNTGPTDTAVYHFVASNAMGSITSSPIHLQVNLSLALGIEGGGSVTRSLPGNTFTNGTIIELEAVPQRGSTFLGWTGDVSSDSPRITVSMTENRRILARFTLVPGNVKFALRWGQWNNRDRGTPAVGQDGSVYRVYDKNLYALDGQTGHTRWSYTAPEFFSFYESEPIILDDGSVLVATSTNAVCLDAATRDVRWRLPAVEGIGVGHFAYLWQRTVFRDHYWRYELLAVRPDSGSVVWRGAESMWAPGELLIADEKLFRG